MEEENSENLSKEEILERSRKENKTGDEREQRRILWSKFAGFAAMIIACGIVMIVNACLSDHISYEIFAVMFTGLGAQSVMEAFVIQNKAARIASIAAAVVIWIAAILYWVLWGMRLAGI